MIPSKYSACMHEMYTKFPIPLPWPLFHSPASDITKLTLYLKVVKKGFNVRITKRGKKLGLKIVDLF